MRIFLLVAMVLMSGCVAQDAIKPAIEKGAEANDAAVQGSRFVICGGASENAIRREFSKVEEARARAALCGLDYIWIGKDPAAP